MRYYKLENLVNLSDGYRKVIQIDNHQLLLIQEGEEIFLGDNRCPHRCADLYQGSISEQQITCPGHCYRFDLKTGAAVSGDTNCSPLTHYDPVFEGSELGVWL